MDLPTTLAASNFTIQFWGVRGKIASPGKETIRYGGNTPCLEMRVGEHRLIFDGGTGLRQLGNHLLRQMPVEAHLFFTHCHWDRIQGFPFFIPAFIPGNQFHIYGAPAIDGESFEERLERQMLGPNFPVPIQVMGSKLEFHSLTIGRSQQIGDIDIETSLLHPEHQSIGYRVTYQDQAVVYATDIDLTLLDSRESLLKLARNAKLLILNSPNYHTGPSENLDPWKPAIALAKTAAVEQLIFSTHNPDDEDENLDQLQSSLQQYFPQLRLAREGMLQTLDGQS
jgi:phosphoribosyl 1,2-cyclic phosphodiesterase